MLWVYDHHVRSEIIGEIRDVVYPDSILLDVSFHTGQEIQVKALFIRNYWREAAPRPVRRAQDSFFVSLEWALASDSGMGSLVVDTCDVACKPDLTFPEGKGGMSGRVVISTLCD
jgi:hypothetical protein